MEYFDIQPGKESGELKEYIKNAILDGVIENNFEQALALMKEKGKEMGLRKRTFAQ